MADAPENQDPGPARREAARSLRPVIEHALTAYGYSPETARTLVDRVITEGRAE
ncbi:hypothetical protein ACIQNU_04315 [Streptomyces sp. NPDC091292]|uniref:hypothetical protein n=1 Tax=Streptomyces sp. NPDC091292 TaxID=3365991 RepID=UPI0038255A8F